MIVICEECGKKYDIDPSRIRGRAASFKCRNCTHIIVVSKPVPPPERSVSETRSTLAPVTTESDGGATDAVSEDEKQRPAIRKPKSPRRRKPRRLSLRAKMLILFLFIPMFLVAGASLLYLWQLETMSNLLVRESSKIVNRLAEEKIADTAASAAM